MHESAGPRRLGRPVEAGEPDVEVVAPVSGPLAVSERLAMRLSRRSLLIRASGVFAAVVGGSSLVKFLSPATAQAFVDCNLPPGQCSCCCGTGCVTTNCYHRYVCGCTSGVAIRHCPGGTVRNNAPYRSQADIQIEPQQTGGYYYIWSYGASDRGWVLASCLTTYSCG